MSSDAGMPRPLRVLLAVPAYAPAYDYGGPIRSLEGLATGLKAAGVDIRVLTTNASAAGPMSVPRGWTERDGVPVRYLPRWLVHDFTPAFGRHALAAMREIDVVHTGTVFATSSIQVLSIARLIARPTVFSPRGAMQPGSLASGRQPLKQGWLAAFRPLYRTVTRFHATSELEAASIRELVGPGAAIDVVPNGTIPPEWAAVLAAKQQARRPRIVAMGRIHPIKAFDELLRAAARLRDAGHELDLEIAGPTEDGAYAAELRRLISELGLGDRCRLCDEVSGERKLLFLAAADVFVLPSHTENLGNVVLEALAHGTAVVASDKTPWRSLPAEGCGACVPNDPESLARAIAVYLESPDLAREQGRRGRQLVEREYSWQAVVPKMLALYDRAMARSSGPRREP